MRTKPLNKPNSMGMIMENFRRYQEVVEAECGPSDNVIYLFESNQRVPTTITVDLLRRRMRVTNMMQNGLTLWSSLERKW